MRPTADIERLIRNTTITTDPQVNGAVLKDLLDTMDQSHEMRSAAIRPNIWSTVMKSKFTKVATAAALVIAVLLAIEYSTRRSRGTNVAWADVIKPIFSARTAALDIIIGSGAQPAVIHDEVMGSRIRRRISNLPHTDMILDLQEGKLLTLDAARKTAVCIGLEGLAEIGNYIEHLRNVIAGLQGKPDSRVENKGLHRLGSRDCVMFVAKSNDETITIWADPATALPVRIDQKTPNMQISCDNIRFDVPFDESRFSMEVPAGYTMIQSPGVDVTKSSESGFVESLRIWAQLMDGQFPDSVKIEDIVKNSATFGRALDRTNRTPQQMWETATRWGQGLMFIRFFKGQGQWHYAGKGAKLGDAKTPIFWYQPQDSPTWRVIYADLRVEDVTPEDLARIEAESAARIRQYEARPTFQGRQTDLWHITGSGSISAHCALALDSLPTNAAAMPICLPYAAAVLQSARIGPDTLEVKTLGEGRYELMLPARRTAQDSGTIEIVWTMPLDRLERHGTHFRANLRGLVPVHYYSLDVILDEGCGYEMTPPFAGRRQGRPFYGNSHKPTTSFGSCSLCIQKSQ